MNEELNEKIRKIFIWCVISLFIFGIVFKLIQIYSNKESQPKVEKGQKWVGINPFKNNNYDTLKVIDISDNHALIEINGDSMIFMIDMVQQNRKLIK